MYNIQPQKRKEVVEFYLSNPTSLRKTAHRFNVNYRSVFKWVKWFREDGEERLMRTYRRPWNRTDEEKEKRIALLKESDPALTVRKAQKILEQEGVFISLKGIWGIWKRFGFAGFDKKNMWNSYVEYISWTAESRKKFNQAQSLFSSGNIKGSAKLLNSIPSLPGNELVTNIPDRLLTVPRKIEKMWCLFGKIPLPIYIRKARNLYEKCKENQLNYSAMRIGILEVIALEWSARPVDKLQKIDQLQKIFTKTENYHSSLLFEPRFTLLISKGIAYTIMLRIREAQRIASNCRRMLNRRKGVSHYFMADLAVLYMNLEEFRKAEQLFLKSIDKVDETTRKMYEGSLAIISLSSGRHREATGKSQDAKFASWGDRSYRALFQSTISLMRGFPLQAIALASSSLHDSRKEELPRNMFLASLTIASAYCSIGEKAQAQKSTTSILSYLRKRKVKKYLSILEHLRVPVAYKNDLAEEDFLPTVKLLILLQNSHYHEALAYAKKKGIQSHFYRYIFFYPEAVSALLKKGKATGLPKAILRLPVFNVESPVYHIRFLGDIQVFKRQNRLPIQMQPKEAAFLIQLALRLKEPNEEIPLHGIFENFWKQSKQPARNLSHLMVEIRKTLKIPAHLLEISHSGENPALCNKGIHFITDYEEYKQLITRARAFYGAGEWGFAKREYQRAFSLFRGEPFRKMYDDWSDDKRLEVLFSYETEIVAFVKELVKSGRKEEAKSLLKKAQRIIPDSDEIADLLNELPNE